MRDPSDAAGPSVPSSGHEPPAGPADTVEVGHGGQGATPGWGRLRRILARLGLIAAVIAASFVLRRTTGLELDPASWRAQIEPLGWAAPAAYVVAASLRPLLLLPSWVVMSAGGLLFGVVGGVVWGSLGFTLGSTGYFAVARYVGRDWVARRLAGRAAQIDARLRRSGAPWVTLYTGIPVSPLTFVHAGLGLTSMPLATFVVAVFCGLVPRIALFSYFGDSLAQGDATQIAVAAVVLLVASAAGAVAVRRLGGIEDDASSSDSSP